MSGLLGQSWADIFRTGQGGQQQQPSQMGLLSPWASQAPTPMPSMQMPDWGAQQQPNALQSIFNGMQPISSPQMPATQQMPMQQPPQQAQPFQQPMQQPFQMPGFSQGPTPMPTMAMPDFVQQQPTQSPWDSMGTGGLSVPSFSYQGPSAQGGGYSDPSVMASIFRQNQF